MLEGWCWMLLYNQQFGVLTISMGFHHHGKVAYLAKDSTHHLRSKWCICNQWHCIILVTASQNSSHSNCSCELSQYSHVTHNVICACSFLHLFVCLLSIHKYWHWNFVKLRPHGHGDQHNSLVLRLTFYHTFSSTYFYFTKLSCISVPSPTTL